MHTTVGSSFGYATRRPSTVIHHVTIKIGKEELQVALSGDATDTRSYFAHEYAQAT